jgi:hypothetical protein
MPWTLPPPEVQRRVSDVLGDPFWEDFKASLERVKLQDPKVEVTTWYRSPADVVRVHRDPRYRGSLTTMHGMGIAQDLLASSTEAADRLEAAARAENFPQVLRYRDRPRLVHVGALTVENWQRSPLRAELERRVRPLLNSVFSERR